MPADQLIMIHLTITYSASCFQNSSKATCRHVEGALLGVVLWDARRLTQLLLLLHLLLLLTCRPLGPATGALLELV